MTHSGNIPAHSTFHVTGGVTNGKSCRNPRMGNINRCMQARGAAGAGQISPGRTLEPERPFIQVVPGGVNTVIPYPTWLGSGDNAWQMTAATLVRLMSIPGLAVLYGGLVQKKWA